VLVVQEELLRVSQNTTACTFYLTRDSRVTEAHHHIERTGHCSKHLNIYSASIVLIIIRKELCTTSLEQLFSSALLKPASAVLSVGQQ
jgi:hypothetical protein